MFTILDVINSLRTAVEAVTPTDQATPDDTFRALVTDDGASRGTRSVTITASGPIPIKPGRSCTDWQTTLSLTVWHAMTSAQDDGTRTVYERALLDSELVAAAIQTWAGTTDGVNQYEISEADLAPNGDGWLLTERTVVVQYSRGA